MSDGAQKEVANATDSVTYGPMSSEAASPAGRRAGPIAGGFVDMAKITLDSQQMADLAVGLSAAVRWYSKAVEGYADARRDLYHSLHTGQSASGLVIFGFFPDFWIFWSC